MPRDFDPSITAQVAKAQRLLAGDPELSIRQAALRVGMRPNTLQNRLSHSGQSPRASDDRRKRVRPEDEALRKVAELCSNDS